MDSNLVEVIIFLSVVVAIMVEMTFKFIENMTRIRKGKCNCKCKGEKRGTES